MPGMRRTPPSYRRHKRSGQAVVTLNGRDVYLGPWGTATSRNEYDRVIAEWLTAGRTHVNRDTAGDTTVVELLNAFRKSGTIPPSHAHDYQAVMKLLMRYHARTAVADFGPLALAGVRKKMIDAGWNRQTINQRVYMTRRIFRWGVEKEMVSPATLQALMAMEGLRAGATEAPEPEKIKPVDPAHVDATIPFMPETIRAMVRLQMLTGMRAGELVIMRTADIDTTGTTWIYRPTAHKTKHAGKLREIAIGPKAQLVLQPYLKPDLTAHVFSPAESEASRRAALTAARKTPAGQGNAVGSNRVRKPARPPGQCYDVPSYRRAIYRACDAAFPPPPDLARRRGEDEGDWKRRLGKRYPELQAWREKHRWHPHQLRHTFATEARRRFGLEHAQRALGHTNANITQVYAAVALEKAVEVAQGIG